MTDKTLLILTHERAPKISRTPYILNHLKEVWAKWGIRIEVAQGTAQRIEADMAWLHVDFTVVTDEYLEYLQDYPVVINGAVTDISKRVFSRSILAQEDSYDGPVIVKTNANSGGGLEYQLAAMNGTLETHPDAARRPWQYLQQMDPFNYPVFPSMQQVPPGVWLNPRLIVEKFLPERDAEGNFKLRVWFFLGDRELGELDTSTSHTVKGSTTFRREIIEEVPEEIRAIRRELGMDYGKFDYGIVEGKPVLYDINRTPVFAEPTLKLFPREAIAGLAEGLRPFVPGMA